MTDVKPEMPKVYYATEPYVDVKMENIKSELSHQLDSKIYDLLERSDRKFEKLREDQKSQSRWLIGIGIALVVAVLIRPYLG